MIAGGWLVFLLWFCSSVSALVALVCLVGLLLVLIFLLIALVLVFDVADLAFAVLWTFGYLFVGVLFSCGGFAF